MQLHYGCKRDNNTLMFEKLGPDTGYDCINNYAPMEAKNSILFFSAVFSPAKVVISVTPVTAASLSR